MLNFTQTIPMCGSSLYRRAIFFSGVVTFLAISPALANQTKFDFGPNTNPNLSSGQGYAPGVGQKARTNVSFDDFNYTPNSNPAAGGNPADLLPITQQNTVAGMEIYSRSGQENYKLNNSQPTQMYSQSPQLQPGQVNPYMAGMNPTNTSLPPTTMGLQATYMRDNGLPGSSSGYTALPSGKGHFEHLNYGFDKSPVPAIYQGVYNNFVAPNVRNMIPNTINSTPLGVLGPGLLPPTSLGSVEINVAAGQRR